MNIAMIGSKGIPFPGEGGGVERHVEELAVRFAAAGHRVVVYVRPRFALDQGEWKGVTLVRLPSIRTKHLDTISHVFFSTIHALFQGFDIIHYHGVGPSTLAWIPRILAPRARVVVTFHSQDRFHKKWGMLARIYLAFGEWTAVRVPHATIAVAHTLERYAKKRFGKTVRYIPNGMQSHEAPPPEALGTFSLRPKTYVLTVARLIRHKGIHFLIEAWKRFETPKQLVIVGAASYTDDYVDYLRALSKEDARIRFVGFQEGEQLGALYAHASLYVHPSESEGLSLSILEAMSYGTPVLISDIPENLEAIDHSGFSFKNGNVEDLVQRLRDILDDEKELTAVGSRGKAFVEKYFVWDTIAERTLDVYKELLEKGEYAARGT